MSIDHYVCNNCKDAMSEYNYIYCANEHILCGDCIPEELQQSINVCDDLYSLKEEDKSLFDQYIEENDYYGIVLKSKFCPCCQKNEKYKDDPEYKEYLRLKAKFE